MFRVYLGVRALQGLGLLLRVYRAHLALSAWGLGFGVGLGLPFRVGCIEGFWPEGLHHNEQVCL